MWEFINLRIFMFITFNQQGYFVKQFLKYDAKKTKLL